MLAEGEEAIEELIMKVKMESEYCSTLKAMIMRSSMFSDFTVDSRKMKMKDSFVLLGSRTDQCG